MLMLTLKRFDGNIDHVRATYFNITSISTFYDNIYCSLYQHVCFLSCIVSYICLDRQMLKERKIKKERQKKKRTLKKTKREREREKAKKYVFHFPSVYFVVQMNHLSVCSLSCLSDINYISWAMFCLHLIILYNIELLKLTCNIIHI